MLTASFFNQIINLGENWKISSVEADHDNLEIKIQLDYIGKQGKCPESGELCSIYDHAASRRWRHLDTMQYKTYLIARVPRVKNRLGKVKTISIDWASAHDRHTYLFEHAVIDLLLASKNQTKTAQLMRCGFNLINRIMHTATKRGMSLRKLEDEVFEVLSIDEKSFKRNHKYISVLSSPDSGSVIDVVEDRTLKAAKTLIDNSLTEDQQGQVKAISMDMWKAYISMAEQKLPHAKIVHDRFHLISYLNKCIDKVRRREAKDQYSLKGSRYALLKNPENLTDKQRIKFESINTLNLEVSKAWQVRENFKSMYGQETQYFEMFTLFQEWAKDAIGKNIKEVKHVVAMMHNHVEGVLYALMSTHNNAMAERLNGKIQEIKACAKGYRTFKNFRSAILFFHGKLNLYPLNSW